MQAPLNPLLSNWHSLVWNDHTRRFLNGWIRREPRRGPKRSKYSYVTNYWRDILYKDPCSYCFGKVSTTADHVVAKANGATKNWSYLAGACWDCNQQKGTESALIFFYAQHQKQKQL